MNVKKSKRPMAWLLTIALLLSLLPSMGVAARAAGESVTTEDGLIAAYNAIPDNDTGTITLAGNIKLSKTFIVDRGVNLTLRTNGASATIIPGNDNFTAYVIPAGANLYNSLIEVVNGSLTINKGVELNPKSKGRSIYVYGEKSSLNLQGCTIMGGNLKQSQGGAGVGSYGAASITIGSGTVFKENNCETTSMCAGGALYASGTPITIDEALFYVNKAHSGGAIYFYGNTLTCTANTYFVGNEAGQRGGAIHDHGTAYLNGTTLDGTKGAPKELYGDVEAAPNKSDQYGGGVYISTDGSTNGRLILNGATISGNQAGNSGAGVFVTDKGTLYVGNGATISGNELSDSQVVPTEYKANNVFVSSSDSKLIAFSKVGAVGISTSNPYYPKIVVRSTATESSNLPSGVIAGYSLEDAADIRSFTYDSAVWLIKDASKDKTAVNTNPECKKGNLWLGLNPSYPSGGESTGNNEVIFDFNVPGQAAVVVGGNPGDAKNLPTVSNITQGQVSYKFLGWFDAPVGGSPAPNPVTIQASSKVYYAQWKVEVTDGGGSESGKGDMRLVYFDQNIAGGGVTAAYVTSGKFSFTVEYEWTNPDEPDADPETRYDTVEVSIPFGFPGDPYRSGYIFKGWGTTAMATTPVSTSWRPTDYVTTLYGIWAANQYTMSWNSNGGSAVAATTQAHDEYVKPPATAPTRSGYTFDGWYLDKGLTIPLTSGTKITGPMTFYAGWSAQIVWSANYTGGAMTTIHQKDGENLQMPPDPVREGYSFDGWYTSATGGSKVSASTKVSGNANYYAHWTVSVYTITWDKNTGDTGGGTTRVNHGTVIDPPTTSPTKTGYTFTGWYLDKACTTPFVNGAIATQNQTFYAGWTPNEHTIQWDANYTGGGNTSIKQHYDEELVVPPDPTRVGFVFGGWYTQQGGVGTRAEAYGTVTKDEIFYANWVREAQSYTVNIDWADHSDNDLVRPGSVRVSLMANDLPTGMSYLFTQADADAGGNLWSHTFTGLPITDVISQPITYSVAITSPVSDEYSYGIENKSATLGYILMTHTLITTDINSFVVWEDEGNNDGYRPSTVSVQLYANGEPVDDAEGRLAISGSGSTWTYSFADFQKYYTDADGNKGLEIKYTLKATPTNAGELDKYTIAYHDYTIVLSHAKDTVTKTVQVEWNDSNDKDGKRPASMTVQLYADNVPVQGKFVSLSAANKWTYTWKDLPQLTAGGRKVVYSAQVTSTLVDYTAKSTEMTIEMTYVPSSTSISAFITWTDENDADGLRPDFVTAELISNGKPTGDTQVLAAANGWTTAWKNYPMYKDGNRIEYTFRIQPMPDGYRADYNGVYDTSGLSAVLTHDRQRHDQTAQIIWNDRNNISGDRLERVRVQLYADGVALEDTLVWVDETNQWKATYSNLPMYRDGGEEIKYSAYLYSSPGKYKPATENMTITMNLDVERVDIPLDIIWSDKNNADGLRPDHVGVILLIDGEVSKYQLTATEKNEWAVVFKGMVAYGYKPSGDGGAYHYSARVIVPDGYEVEYIADTAILTQIPAVKDVTATVTWKDNENQYGVRPERVTISLYADYWDGNGAAHTSLVNRCYATDGWEVTFKDVPAYRNGKNVLYSVVVSGDLTDYVATYDGMDVYLTHKAYEPGGYKTDYTATLLWQDGRNAHNSRNYGAILTLNANGESYRTYTLTENDVSGTDYTWSHTFSGLPTYQNGEKVQYTISVTTGPNYVAAVDGNTITLTNVADKVILVRWSDNGNNDGLRPTALTLDLYADAAQTGKSVTMEHVTGDTWRCTFEKLPVWSTAQTDKTIAYTWLPPAAEVAALNANQYSIQYNSYEQSTVGGELVYVVNIDRAAEVADYPAVIRWSDGTDRDGLRPAELTVKLYADYGDGKGAVDTGKTATIKGGNEDASWSHAFEGLPVWVNQGKAIIYTMTATAPDGYELTGGETIPELTLNHTPERVEMEAYMIWEDASNVGGLKRFSLTAELMIDGDPSRQIGALNEGNEYRQTWGNAYVYHDHGIPYVYSFRFSTGEMPADYDMTVDGFAATIKRVRFNLGGTITDNVGVPVKDADVTLYNSDRLAVGATTTGGNGRYSFGGVSVGDYTVRAVKTLNGKATGTAEISITNSDLNATDIQLMPDSGGDEEYTYTLKGVVMDSNGLPAAGAKVSVFTTIEELVATTTTDATGCYQVAKLSNGTYLFAVVYTLDGKDYTAAGQAVTIFNADKTAPDIVVAVPKPEQPADKPCVVSGKVTNELGKALADILVVVYDGDDARYTAVVSDEMGEYKLTGVPDGTYKLVYHYAGAAVVTKEITVAGEDALTVPDTAIDTTAKSGYGTLTGVAVDAQGKPVEGAEVYVYTIGGEQVGYQKTGKNGAYRFDLPAGEYTVEIRKPFENITDTTVDVSDDAAESGGSVTADSYTISGTVLDEEDEPVEGVAVYLYGTAPASVQVEPPLVAMHREAMEDTLEPEEGALAPEPMVGEDAAQNGGAFVRLMETTTDGSGNYEFTELPAGEYVVKIAHGIGGNGGSVDIPVIAEPGSKAPEDSNITVTTESYTVSGVVTDKDGKPVEGAVVTIHDSADSVVGEVITGADGHYVFPGLSEDTYTVTVSYPDFDSLGGGKVEIEEGGTVVFQGYAVSGVVKDDKDTLIKGAVISLTNGETAVEYLTATDKDGKFRVAVPNGTYAVKATYNGKEASATVTVNNKDMTVPTMTIKLSTGGGNNPGGGGGSGGDNPSGGGSGGGNTGGGGGSTGGGGGSTGGGGSHGTQVRAYIFGLPDGTFGPARNITRAEVAAILSRVAEDFDANANYSADYNDVSANAWYQANVGFCSAKNLMNGRGGGMFAPDASITRGEFAAVVARLLGLSNVKGKTTFPDAVGNWAEGYISQLADKGAITGLPDGTFAPDALITRAEAVAIVNRALGRNPDADNLTQLVQSGKAGFPDVANTHWAYWQVIEASVDHTHK